MSGTVDADQYAYDQRDVAAKFSQVNRRIDEILEMIGRYSNHRRHFTDPKRGTISTELRKLSEEVEELKVVTRKTEHG